MKFVKLFRICICVMYFILASIKPCGIYTVKDVLKTNIANFSFPFRTKTKPNNRFMFFSVFKNLNTKTPRINSNKSKDRYSFGKRSRFPHFSFPFSRG